MSPSLHGLAQHFPLEQDRPSRADAEAAFRAIIRWASRRCRAPPVGRDAGTPCHHCMTTRGFHKPGGELVTSRMLGCFRDNPPARREFLSMVA